MNEEEEEVIVKLEKVYESLDILERDVVLSNDEWLTNVRYYRMRQRELETQLNKLRKDRNPDECGLL